MKSSKEMAHDVFQRINAYKSEKERKRKKLIKMTSAISSVCAIMLVTFLLYKSGTPIPPRDTITNINDTTNDITQSDIIIEKTEFAAEITTSEKTGTAMVQQTSTAVMTIAPTEPINNDINEHETEIVPPDDDPIQPSTSTIKPAVIPTEPKTDAPDNPDAPGTPNSVFSKIKVDYNTALEKFGHPIAYCENSDFLNYKLGIISQNGDLYSDKAICLNVIYEFSCGNICIMDNSRFVDEIDVCNGDLYSYCDRDFYVEDDFYGDIKIGYAPSQDSPIAYQAIFSKDIDLYEIMELIISIEI